MKKDKLLICFNTPGLGGAERSMTHQALQMLDKYDLYFCIPRFSNTKSPLESYLLQYVSPDKIHFLKYPSSLYHFSQEGFWRLSLLLIPFALIKLIFSFLKLKIRSYQIVWLNGNKIALPFFLFIYASPFYGRVVWHHRDYFSEKYLPFYRPLLKRIVKTLEYPLVIVANSYSVQKQLRHHIDIENLLFKTVYNPTGFNIAGPPHTSLAKIEVIGVLSMMAPWKGIHQVVQMAKMYRHELIELGIKKIHIYGEEIYLTKGSHLGYHQQLKSMVSDDFICFKGQVSPEQALSEIDLLIHSSLRAEPFGRVILEAFLSGVPVISTALGGAAELVSDKETGFVFSRYDYCGLFEQIKLATTQIDFTNQMMQKAFKKGQEVELLAAQQLENIFSIETRPAELSFMDLDYGKNPTYL